MAADLLPTLAIGAAARYGLGPLLKDESNMLLAHPKMGLNVTGGGVTGFITGSLLSR